jgi:hypothetical protein
MVMLIKIKDYEKQIITEKNWLINFKTQTNFNDIGLGAFAASELDKVFSGYQPRHHHHHHITLMMMTEMDIETSENNVPLPRLIAREDFIKF